MMHARVSVVIPTYREAENLPVLVPRIAEALCGLAAWEVVVVDDDSRDGTDGVCAELATRRLSAAGGRRLVP